MKVKTSMEMNQRQNFLKKLFGVCRFVAFPFPRSNSVTSPVTALFTIFLLAAILSLITCRSLSHASLYDDEVAVSGGLQTKLQEQLDKVFGKNKISVLVKVEFMIEPEVRDAVKKAFVESSRPASKPAPSNAGKPQTEFLWKGKKTEPGSFVLPGFQAKKETGGAQDTAVVPTEMPDSSLVLAAGTMIRKISVKLSVDKNLSAEAETAAGSIASTFLNLNQSRGDILSVERVSMPSVWSEILENPEMVSQIAVKVLLIGSTILIVILLIFGAISFARTIRRSTETIAGALSSRYSSMEVKYKGLPGGASGTSPEEQIAGQIAGGEPVPALPDNSKSGSAEKVSMEEGTDKSKVQLNIAPDQVQKLHYLLSHEHPDNIALVLAHLNPDVRKSFMALLPKDVAAEVLSSLASVRFLEPEMIVKLKEELEYRLQGTVGGIEKAVEVLKSADGKTRLELMEVLKQRNPDLAKSIRRQIFFFEDVFLLKDEELRQLVAAVKLTDIAVALAKSDPGSVEKIQKCFPKKTQDVLQQTMSFSAGQSEEKMIEAQEKILSQLYNMVRQGKVANPLENLADESRLLENKENKETVATTQ